MTTHKRIGMSMLLVTAFFMFAGSTNAATITVNDVENQWDETEDDSQTLLSYDTSGATGPNTVLVVFASSGQSNSGSIDGVKFGTADLTQAVQTATTATSNAYNSIWYLWNPSTTPADIVASYAGNTFDRNVGAFWLDNVDTSFNPIVQSAQSGNNTTNNISMNITLTKDNMAYISQIVNSTDKWVNEQTLTSSVVGALSTTPNWDEFASDDDGRVVSRRIATVDNAAILTDAWDHPTRSGKAHNALTGIAFAPIPEPASLALLGIGGLLALAGLGRRRSR